ncbi:universal stress protein [Kibdelosporangium aridum]|nr:universal stress protein [Kibdelosporangium aridum]
MSSGIGSRKRAMVVGFDGSDGARKALDWAVAEAKVHAQQLVIVYSVGPHVATTAYGWHPAVEFGDARLTDEARAAVEPVVAEINRTTPELDVTTRFPQSEPAQAMMEVSAELGAESMVVGSSGLSAIPRVILGSTAADLVRMADRPIIVVRGHTDDRHTASNVLVGIDGTATSGQILAYAFRYAAAHSIRLLAIHGLPGQLLDPMIPRMESSPDSAEQAAAEVLGANLDEWRARFPDVSADLEIVETTPARALLERSSQAGLVVVGSRQRGALHRTFLGSVSHAMVYHADCSVAVIPLSQMEDS